MKRIPLLFVAISLGLHVQAQQSKVVSAYNYLNYYLKDKDIDNLKSARLNIDEAAENPSSAVKPKTWYYRGNIYLAIQESKNPELIEATVNPLLTASESYKKVFELDAKYEYAEESYEKAMIGYRNLGIMAFNKNDFNAALGYFESSTELSAKKGVVDTSAIENSSIAAMRAGNSAKSIQYLKQLISFNSDKDGSRFIQLIKAQNLAGDSAAAKQTLMEGRTKFPNDQKLLTEELNGYLQSGKSAEAEKLLAIAIEKDPTNHLLHYASGTIFEDLGKREQAITAYKNSIEIKPDFWEGYFNLGAIYNNEAKRLQDVANNIPAGKDNKKYEEGKKLAEAQFNLALPNLEKALELAPKDSPDLLPLLKTLKQIYSLMGMNDKYNEMKKRIEQ
jgi:tetratricopeptide (TPR) repeat protein